MIALRDSLLMMRFLSFIFFFSFSFFLNADVVTHFNSIKNNSARLYNFLKSMPKGGELHFHLPGSIPAHTLVSLAKKGHYCFDKADLSVAKKINSNCPTLSKEIRRDPHIAAAATGAWSMHHFNPTKESGHDHFFSSFSKFMPIVDDNTPFLLSKIITKAANQNECYLEIMSLPDQALSTQFAPSLKNFNPSSFNYLRNRLLADKNFQKNISYTVQQTEDTLKNTHQLLKCDINRNSKPCQIRVTFQYTVLREQPLSKVFAQALNGFEAAKRSKHIVGVNLVQAENGPISLADYKAQMTIFNYLHRLYPQVHIALHAGELTPTLTPKQDLVFHIRDAINLGHAERIGHGADINFEQDYPMILKKMKDNNIPIEINLTSNQKVLNLNHKNHPFLLYFSHQIPIILSTDDEGILETSLTHEYLKAVRQYNLDYPSLKKITRNSIHYSFLAGDSIWDKKHPQKYILNRQCLNLNSQSCLTFIKKNEKAQVEYQLEKKLAQFESQFGLKTISS